MLTATPMPAREDRLRRFVVAVVGAVGLAALCLAISDLTAGAEYGGRYDVPAVNYISWFAFLVFAAAAIMIVVAGLFRLSQDLRKGAKRRR